MVYEGLNSYKPVLIGLEIQNFETMRTTVNCCVCYQKVIFGKYCSYKVLTAQRRYILNKDT